MACVSSQRAACAQGQVVPQQLLAHTSAHLLGVDFADCRRLEMVIDRAMCMGGAQCCDVIIVSPLACHGCPQPGAVQPDGAMLTMAKRCKRAASPELEARGLRVLVCEVGGRCSAGTWQLVQHLVPERSWCALEALRGEGFSVSGCRGNGSGRHAAWRRFLPWLHGRAAKPRAAERIASYG